MDPKNFAEKLANYLIKANVESVFYKVSLKAINSNSRSKAVADFFFY